MNFPTKEANPLLYLVIVFISVTSSIASANSGSSESVLLAVGPASFTGEDNNVLTVNGQTFVLVDGIEVTNEAGISGAVSSGDYLAIYGDLIKPGASEASEIVILDDAFVAGSSAEYLKVVVGSVDQNLAIANSGDTRIDFSAALHNTDLISLNAGDIADFYGTSFSGTVWALNGSKSLAASSSSAESANSSSANGLRGSGVRGLRGSGVRGLRGSGVRGLRGSGVRGLRGSGIR